MAAFTGWQSVVFKDFIRSSYRRDPKARDANGDYLATSWVLKFSDAPCSLHNTPNYDRPNPAGQLKEANLFTSDKVDINTSWDVADGDLQLREDRNGNQSWGIIDGVPKDRAITGHQTYYMIPTTERPA